MPKKGETGSSKTWQDVTEYVRKADDYYSVVTTIRLISGGVTDGDTLYVEINSEPIGVTPIEGFTTHRHSSRIKDQLLLSARDLFNLVYSFYNDLADYPYKWGSECQARHEMGRYANYDNRTILLTSLLSS
jgi:hypothetical protein